MKIASTKTTVFCLFTLLFSITSNANAEAPTTELTSTYLFHHLHTSDINEHLPVIRRFAKECSSAVEIGVRSMVSTWSVLHGLTESPYDSPVYLGIDLEYPPEYKFNLAKKLATDNGISFQFCAGNDLDMDIPMTDLLFIDTLHTYQQLTYELEKFSSNTKKYIILHDTSQYFEFNNCESYNGDYSEYPTSISRTKKGLWPAVLDFLTHHPEWSLKERHLNNNGLTVLNRNAE